jgi:hypothetical protein
MTDLRAREPGSSRPAIPGEARPYNPCRRDKGTEYLVGGLTCAGFRPGDL